MKTIFVTRHPGAAEWAARHGFAGVEVVSHFAPEPIPMRVIGTLPVNLAAAVCAAGGQYYHLALDLPAEARGRELTADDMERYGARVERFYVLSDATATAIRWAVAGGGYEGNFLPGDDPA